MQLLFGEHPFEKPADVEEGSVKRTLHRILKVNHNGIARQTRFQHGQAVTNPLLTALADT